MTIGEVYLLNFVLYNKHHSIENVTPSQRETLGGYFNEMRENLEGYSRNGWKKIVSILKDMYQLA